jgi:uncharacterized membrane protein HdeD (DUF308 family)
MNLEEKTMEYEFASDMEHHAGWSGLWSGLMMAAGILAIAVPWVAGVAVTAIVGWLLIVSGILHVAFAWRGAHGAAVAWEALLGALYGFTGLAVILNPIAGLASLTLVLSAYLFFEGVLELVLFFLLRSVTGAGWFVVDGLVTLALAALIAITWPSSAVWVVGTMAGISMLFSGFTRLMLGRATRPLGA